MIETKKIIYLSSLVIGLMLSSIFLIVQVYEYRITFSEIEKLNQKNEDLSFKSNLLLDEVEYFRNQLTIREVATNKLGMRSPTLKEQILIENQRIPR
tara:strand:- start:15153 stop:15443 length:291 start_codon:yes stop_codon:yes gene_type:complete